MVTRLKYENFVRILTEEEEKDWRDNKSLDPYLRVAKSKRGITTGGDYDGITYNGRKAPVITIYSRVKEYCIECVVSHEFIHHMLTILIGEDAAWKWDNIHKDVEEYLCTIPDARRP
jgi:hypothetical protein